jgi:hypothetical protein
MNDSGTHWLLLSLLHYEVILCGPYLRAAGDGVPGARRPSARRSRHGGHPDLGYHNARNACFTVPGTRATSAICNATDRRQNRCALPAEAGRASGSRPATWHNSAIVESVLRTRIRVFPHSTNINRYSRPYLEL